MSSYFAAKADKQNLSYAVNPGGSLQIKVLAIVPGTQMPIRNSDGEVETTFEATKDLISEAISSFKSPGMFDVDHKLKKSQIGFFDNVSFNDGFMASGTLTCPTWISKVKSGDYSGVSAFGSVEGDLSHPNKMNICAISFLSNENSPDGGACAYRTKEDPNKCGVTIMENGSEVDPKLAIEASAVVESAWSPDYKSFWNFMEDKDGKIDVSKGNQVFLMHTGDGSLRGDYKYPFVKIENGKPVPDPEGLHAAFSRAMQNKETSILSRIKTEMKKAGMQIPDGLKAIRAKYQLKASYNKENKTFNAQVIDPEDDYVVSEKEIMLQNEGLNMNEIVETPKVEAAAATPAVVETPAPAVQAAVPEVPAAPEVPVAAPTPVAVEQPKVETPVTQDPWSIIKTELGIASKEDFLKMKALADEVPGLKENLSALEAFQADVVKKNLRDMYPPSLWEGEVEKDGKKIPKLDIFYQESKTLPAAVFNQRYQEDSLKFAASKTSGKMAGSAVEASSVTDDEKGKQERLTHIRALQKKR